MKLFVVLYQQKNNAVRVLSDLVDPALLPAETYYTCYTLQPTKAWWAG